MNSAKGPAPSLSAGCGRPGHVEGLAQLEPFPLEGSTPQDLRLLPGDPIWPGQFRWRSRCRIFAERSTASGSPRSRSPSAFGHLTGLLAQPPALGHQPQTVAIVTPAAPRGQLAEAQAASGLQASSLPRSCKIWKIA